MCIHKVLVKIAGTLSSSSSSSEYVAGEERNWNMCPISCWSDVVQERKKKSFMSFHEHRIFVFSRFVKTEVAWKSASRAKTMASRRLITDNCHVEIVPCELGWVRDACASHFFAWQIPTTETMPDLSKVSVFEGSRESHLPAVDTFLLSSPSSAEI